MNKRTYWKKKNITILSIELLICLEKWEKVDQEVFRNRKLYVRDIEGRRRGRPRVPRSFTGDPLPLEMFVKRFLTLSGGEIDLKPTAAKSGPPHLLHGGLGAADLLEEDQSVPSFAIDHHLIYRSKLMELHVQVLFRHTIWNKCMLILFGRKFCNKIVSFGINIYNWHEHKRI